jgi:hypothetical protein
MVMSDPGDSGESNQSETAAEKSSAAYPLRSASWSSGGGSGGGGRRGEENEALRREGQGCVRVIYMVAR